MAIEKTEPKLETKKERKIDFRNRFGSPFQWLTSLVVGLTSGAWTFRNLVSAKFLNDADFRQGFLIINAQKKIDLAGLADKHITDSIDILRKHVGEEPAFQKFVEARGKILQARGIMEVLPHASRRPPEAIRNYTEAAENFFKTCRDQINKARRTPEFRAHTDKYIRTSRATKLKYGTLTNQFGESVYGLESTGVQSNFLGIWQRFKNFGDGQKAIIFTTLAAIGAGIGVTMMIFNQLNTRDKLNDIDKQAGDNNRKLDALIDGIGVTPPKTILPSPPKVEEQPSTRIDASLAERENVVTAAVHAR